MGKLAVYKYVAAMFLVIQIIASIFTIIGLFGGDVSPIGHSARAMLVYALPLLIIANALLLIYWLVRRRWFFALIPVVTIACCIPYIGTLYQFRSLDKGSEAKEGLKIASYNVAMFGRETSGFKALDILAEIRRQKVDVLCMQEYNEFSGDKKNSESYKEFFPYMQKGRDDMVIFSRYPIKGSKTILFDDTNNSAMWADIDVNGRRLRVFNVHLETTGVNSALHQANKQESKGQLVERSALLRAIYGGYTRGMAIRAQQADVLAAEIEKSPYPVILCGDFNDVPYSYVYRKMKGDLVDGFKESGEGFMYTMRDGKKRVRIDYIFHNEEMESYNYRTMNVTYSDHLPVFMRIGL